MNNLNSPELIKGVQIWTGWGKSIRPNRDDRRIEEAFGKEVAEKMLPLIKTLEEDFYSSDAQFVAYNLEEMGKQASQDFREIYPTISDNIVEVFAWCYTFDFK
jgi:hypothetical protein